MYGGTNLTCRQGADTFGCGPTNLSHARLPSRRQADHRTLPNELPRQSYEDPPHTLHLVRTPRSIGTRRGRRAEVVGRFASELVRCLDHWSKESRTRTFQAILGFEKYRRLS